MKNLKNYVAVLATVFYFASNLYAQETKSVIQPTATKKWGIEFNVVWPFVPGVEIYTLKGTYTTWQKKHFKGDAIVGLLYRPGTKNDENAEQFSEIGTGIGYRQFFWKGLHVETILFSSFAQEERNKIDGKNYSGYALTTEFYVGYKFDFLKQKKVSMYLMPQAGIGYNAVSLLGPASEENRPFPAINLQVGINF